VLTLRWIMRPLEPGETVEGPEVDVTTVVRDAIPILARTELPLVAVESGRPVGVVDRGAALTAIAGEDG
jgi:glycine betaine/proline transport system ATP-binding protein